jgi:hypothetical protein
VSRISAIVLSATILTSACVATSASALGTFHPPYQTSISNQSAQTGSSKLPYAQNTTVYGSNPLKKPFTTSNSVIPASGGISNTSHLPKTFQTGSAVIPASGGISNTSHLPFPTKTFPTGNVIIPANGGISSTSHLPFPTNGGSPTPASNPAASPPSQTTTGGPVNMGPIVVGVSQGSYEVGEGYHHEPRQVLGVASQGPVMMVDASSTTRAACGCSGFTEDGGYMTWRKFINANGAPQLVCVKATD